MKVLEEALGAGAVIESAYYAPEALVAPAPAGLLDRLQAQGTRTFALRAGVMETVADTVTPQPVLGVAKFVDVPLETVTSQALIVVCIDVRDPGNLGAMIRSADAAGVGALVCGGNSADCYNPKTVRASAGSLFHFPIVLGGDPDAILSRLSAASVRSIGALARDGEDYANADLSGRIALVFGNEASGLSDEIVARLDATVSIPMIPGTESLNVAMAAAVLCFEVARRRRLGSLATS